MHCYGARIHTRYQWADDFCFSPDSTIYCTAHSFYDRFRASDTQALTSHSFSSPRAVLIYFGRPASAIVSIVVARERDE